MLRREGWKSSELARFWRGKSAKWIRKARTFHLKTMKNAHSFSRKTFKNCAFQVICKWKNRGPPPTRFRHTFHPTSPSVHAHEKRRPEIAPARPRRKRYMNSHTPTRIHAPARKPLRCSDTPTLRYPTLFFHQLFVWE